MSEPETIKKRQVKVLVWDLDDTLWHGTLLEGDTVQVRQGVPEILRDLDQRGILHSIASKNDAETAAERLRTFGLLDYFLYPQIHWSAKSQSIRRIAESINVGLDAVAFVDDQPFEREEVGQTLPEVMILSPEDLSDLLERPELKPRFITDESAIRRRMYQADIERNRAEEEFQGPTEEFLAGLGMRFGIAPAGEADLQRAEELTVRTNQLNSTGVTYSYEELDLLRRSPAHLLLVASLEDRFGTYGKIGLAVVEKAQTCWTLRLLLMSCRVMSRGVGSILLSHLLAEARRAGVRFLADFRDTGRNRMMKVAYRFAGFRELERDGDRLLLEHDLEAIQPWPEYVEVALSQPGE
ncbi:MAG TPA: HAD-IIIC family phosphatase [Thermoanaerobaculia bacterium]|nr:HAD-IIIC family phosphatase [Thermoanaerobaculia bacterium]